MKPASEVKAVLASCQQVELAMAGFYDRLATLHQDSHIGAARVWRKTANEERNHAAQFKMAIDAVGSMIQSVRLDLTDIDKAAAAVNLLCDECQVRTPTVEEAARAAITFEHALLGIHLETVAIFSNPKHKQLFRAMMAADRDHVSSIEALLGITPAPREITPPPVTQTIRTNRK